ncbi:DnaJ-class molecular chaperone [Citromicrobium phage vB_CbaS-RXM]|nr:DnaJ-class molecular chaperone [Citromicrobium phage vB_CbaS-RXM]
MPSNAFEFIERYGVSGKLADFTKSKEEIAVFKTDFSKAEERVLAAMAAAKQDDFYRSMLGDFVSATTNTVDNPPATFGPAKIQEMMELVKATENVPSAIYGGEAVAKKTGPDHRMEGQPVFGGVKVQKSSVFPYESTCSKCNGTGEGIESTYCQPCHGQGATRIVGMMESGRRRTLMEIPNMVLLTEPLPKKFAPSLPTGLVPKPPMCKGLA